MFGLDQVILVGSIAVAAVAQRSVRSNSRSAALMNGKKFPVAILIRRMDVTMAFEIDGPQIVLDDFERRFPGQRAEFERIAITNR